MPRAANPFYHGADQQLGMALGQTLGRALFGDPEAAAQLALRQAQADTYAASAQESRAHAGLYGSQQQGVDIQNTASQGLPALIQSMFAPPPAPTVAPHPVDPLAVLPEQDTSRPYYAPGQADLTTMRGGFPAAIAAMVQMQGDKVDPRQVMGTLGAFMGDDEMARRGLVAQGHTPGEKFAITPDRADAIRSDEQSADYSKATGVATINHATDIPVERIRSGDRRYAADRSYDGRVYAADSSADARRDVSSLGKEIGFSLVNDVLPGARMTSGERSPKRNREVGGVGDSSHLPGDGVEAFDIEPGTGARTFDDAVAAMRGKYGSRLVEAIDETHRPGHGPHWHFAIADPPGGKQPTAKAPKQVSAATSNMLDAELKAQLIGAGMNITPGAMADISASVANDYQRTGNPAESVRNVLQRVRERVTSADQPPVRGAQKAPDGHWYVKRGGQFFRVDKG